ncbi:MAG: ATP synthase F0 subunit B [Polyangiaceae bacterium]
MSATLTMNTHGSFGLLSAAAASVEVDVNPQLVLTQLVLLTLLFLILKPLLFDPLIKVFEARDRRIAGARKQARDMDEEAAELLRKYETQMAEVHRVASEERDKIRAEVLREEARILAEARAEAQEILDKGRAKLREEGQALEFALGQSSSEIARDVAARVLGREVS